MLTRSKLRHLPISLFALLGISPILIAMGAGLIGEFHGWEMHERGPPPQSELHATLLKIGIVGWFSLVTIPAAVVLSLLWLGVLAVMNRRTRRTETE